MELAKIRCLLRRLRELCRNCDLGPSRRASTWCLHPKLLGDGVLSPSMGLSCVLIRIGNWSLPIMIHDCLSFCLKRSIGWGLQDNYIRPAPVFSGLKEMPEPPPPQIRLHVHTKDIASDSCFQLGKSLSLAMKPEPQVLKSKPCTQWACIPDDIVSTTRKSEEQMRRQSCTEGIQEKHSDSPNLSEKMATQTPRRKPNLPALRIDINATSPRCQLEWDICFCCDFLSCVKKRIYIARRSFNRMAQPHLIQVAHLKEIFTP
jgi:hypothetical protein